MKIAIIGYSGSGKSTLARKLAQHHSLPCLHLDTVHHLPGWGERSREESRQIVGEFLKEHDSWVIDGNYSKLHYEDRMEQADQIVMLLFNRFACFYRALGRYFTYRNTSRPDMAQGCQEKFDWEFGWWILKNGRKKEARQRYKRIAQMYPDRVVIIKNQRQLDAFTKNLT